MKTADWYFDFISPFAYLQSEALDYLADPARFAGCEYARLDGLPVGAARREAGA